MSGFTGNPNEPKPKTMEERMTDAESKIDTIMRDLTSIAKCCDALTKAVGQLNTTLATKK